MKFLLPVICLVFPITYFAQDIPPNFQYQRETGQKSGFPIFHVSANTDSIAYDARQGNTFEVLIALTEPDLDKYAVGLMNAKKTFQLSTGKDKSCSLNIDGEETQYPKFIFGTKGAAGLLKIESVSINVTKLTFEKLLKGNDITIRCGVVKYNLDQDNIDALRYLANQINTDLKRRNKKILNIQ